jgi:DNA-binding XRE family transcriptional regulator
MRKDLEDLLRRAQVVQEEIEKLSPELERYNILLIQELLVLCDGQNKAAKKLGVHHSYLTHVSSGKYPLSISLAARVARAFLQKNAGRGLEKDVFLGKGSCLPAPPLG